MSDTHYELGNTQAGRDAFNVLQNLANAWDRFTRLRGVLIQQKDNDQTGDAVFEAIADRYDYSTGEEVAVKQAAAAASFAEIDSAFGAADAAITQMLNRHL
jgi:hypothetical protein